MKSVDSISCWMLSISLSMVNMSSGWIWISYATVSDFSSQFYDATLSQINWISLLFGVIISVAGLPMIWFIDRFGIKKTISIAAVLNLLCVLLRSVSSFLFVPINCRYAILVSGSVFGAIAQPMSLFSSTKLASTWFSVEKRANANTLASMGNPLGVLIGSLLSPLIVSHKNDIAMLNNLYLILPGLTMIVTIVSVYFAPNNENTILLEAGTSFYQQIKLCLTNYKFVILNTAFAINIAVFTTYSTLIQQILCPFGYSDKFSGVCGALFLGLGFPGVVVCVYLVHKTGGLVIIVKSFIMLTSIGMIGFSITSTYPNQDIFIVISVCWMGFFGFGVYPICLELAAETAYPAGEVITTGLLLFFSQVIGMVMIPVAQVIAIPVPQLSGLSACSVEDIRNYWIANCSIATLGVVNASILMLSFFTKYKRTMTEKEVLTDDLPFAPLR